MKKNALLALILLQGPAWSTTPHLTKEQFNHFYQNHLKDKLIFQVGFLEAYQGKNQSVKINDLIGDAFTVTDGSNMNALIGLGYYLDARSFGPVKFQYGLDAMYLMPTSVNGQVLQEQAFDNFSYSYKVTNVPIYTAIKAITDTPRKNLQLYFDGGIGPNIISISNFNQAPLNSFTIPEQLFNSSTKADFSAMIGVGLRTTEIAQRPLECGYRFMYLGQSELAINNPKVANNLSTGQSYAHSLVCGLTF